MDLCTSLLAQCALAQGWRPRLSLICPLEELLPCTRSTPAGHHTHPLLYDAGWLETKIDQWKDRKEPILVDVDQAELHAL